MKNRNKSFDAELAALAQKRDEDIDTSDIPEIKDWSGAAIYRDKPAINAQLRRRIHFLEGHNQSFFRCESGWCNPGEDADPALYNLKVMESCLHELKKDAIHVIHNEEELREYTDRLFKLTELEYRDPIQTEMIELLTLLIEIYEKKHYPVV
jgi:hypothetical protein